MTLHSPVVHMSLGIIDIGTLHHGVRFISPYPSWDTHMLHVLVTSHWHTRIAVKGGGGREKRPTTALPSQSQKKQHVQCVLRPPWHNPLDAPPPPSGTARHGTGRKKAVYAPPPPSRTPQTLPKIGP